MENGNKITIEQAKETFMFDFLLSEMRKRNTAELTQDIINAAYRNTVAFLNDEENKRIMMQRVKGYIANYSKAKNQTNTINL